MTEEIKEILEQIQKYLENQKYYEKGIISGSVLEEPLHLRYLKVKILLNYITNLQKENEKLQEELQKADSITQSCIFEGSRSAGKSYRQCLNWLEDYKQRNEKAIEYIENHTENIDRGTYYEDYVETYDLLNILQGGDE